MLATILPLSLNASKSMNLYVTGELWALINGNTRHYILSKGS